MSTYKYTQCRAFGHLWRPTIVDKYKDSGETLYVQHLECVTCETLKAVTMGSRGQLYGNIYHYPDDYQLKGRNSKARNMKMRRGYLGI